MSINRKLLLRLLVYTCLILGTVIFTFPFVVMVATSMKVDSELFPEKLQVFPNAPHARRSSPYIDTDYYQYAVTDLTEPYLPSFAALIQQADYDYPSAVKQDAELKAQAQHAITLGFARRLERTLPPAVWKQGEEILLEAVRRELTPDLMDELFRSVYRWFGISRLRIRSYGLIEQELGRDLPVSQRFRVDTPDTVRLEDTVDHGMNCAVIHTHFTKGNVWRIEIEEETEFDVNDLHRIQLYFRPDDNWHQLHCRVEMRGALYQSVRPVYPANYDWGVLTWQEEGPDDLTNKIKIWTHLKKVDTGTHYVSDPNRIKIIFELRRSSALGAWWGKMTRNYVETVRHIPVWRYTATSLYLVILNVTLAIFSCSMVAYAMSRLSWPGRGFCFILMLATMMIPPQVTMIPGFLIWKELRLYNTLVPLWLPAVFGSPFFIFLLCQFFKTIPRDLEDAARIDGCNYWQIYWQIMLPLVKPTLAVIAVGTFMGTWNNFMGPLIMIADQNLYPLAYGLFAFSVQVANNPALTMAGSFMMTVPIIIVFFFAQRYFIQGVTLTGMKG